MSLRSIDRGHDRSAKILRLSRCPGGAGGHNCQHPGGCRGWSGNILVVAVLCVVAAAAERGRIRISAVIQESISLLPTLLAAALFGPLAAMLVAVASMAPELRPRESAPSPFLRWAIYSCTRAIAAAAVGISVQAVLRTFGSDVAPTLAATTVGALAAQRMFALYQAERKLRLELGDANDVLERVNLSFASALVATLDARDRYTAGHSTAVAVYARDIAGRMGLSAEEQSRAHLAGFVHDVGKIGLPAGLVEKPGALTFRERMQMEQHPVIGERILRNVDSYAEVADVVRHHHERMDGRGYPDCISGDQIPLLARIIAVADAYNAMTSDRPYRDAMPSRIARLRLAQSVGTQFDRSVVEAFEAVLAVAPEDYRLGRAPEFRLDVQRHEAPRRMRPSLGLAVAHAS